MTKPTSSKPFKPPLEINRHPLVKEEIKTIKSGYSKRLKQLSDDKRFGIEPLIGFDKEDKKHCYPTIAYRLLLTDLSKKRGVESLFVTDWDDTIEPYRERKNRFCGKLFNLIFPDSLTDQSSDIKLNFPKLYRVVNQAARVLPPDGTHPKIYSPLLELATWTTIRRAKAGHDLPKELRILMVEIVEENVQNFITQCVLPRLRTWGRGIVLIDDPVRHKPYLKEARYRASAIPFNQTSDLIAQGIMDQDIWDEYVRQMAPVNISERELTHFDLPITTYWMISTFGQTDFQLTKVINSLKWLKDKEKRLPDEILLFTQGRKAPVLNLIAEQFPSLPHLYLDNSPRQIARMAKTTFILIYAKRRGNEPPPPGTIVANMEKESLSQILERALET